MQTTKKLIIALILVIIGSGIVSVSDVDPLLNAFIADGIVYTAFRMIAVALLVVLLVKNPPRSPAIRGLLAVGSAVLVSALIYQFMTSQIYLVDTFVFLELAIIFCIESLETYEVKRSRRDRFSLRRAR